MTCRRCVTEEGEAAKTLRAQMEAHRATPVCASCHKLMDPIGFALENFDAVGSWRTQEAAGKIDASGQLADGTKIDGVVALRNSILARPEVFVTTMTEKLWVYALGRGVEAYDRPAIRRVVRDAAKDKYRFSSLVRGIARTAAFQMRTKPADPVAVSPDTRAIGGTVFLFKNAIPRRQFLRGMGVTVALPLLDAMWPAMTAHGAVSGAAADPVRRHLLPQRRDRGGMDSG